MAESQAYGSYLNVGIAGDGTITKSNGVTSFSFRCNNKEFLDGAYIGVCAPMGESEWKWTYTLKGKHFETILWDVSPDGKMFTIHSSEIRPDGTQKVNEGIYSRRSGTAGFAGRWQDATPLKGKAKIMGLAIRGGVLHITYPEFKIYADATLNGSIVPIHGPQIRSGAAISITAMSSQELYAEWRFGGKITRGGAFDLSQDGRTIVVNSWALANPDEKNRLVYDKQ
ncbi:MAG: hypothetical protein WB439_04195 [Acidobacteriaceae bacterium]